MYRISQIIQDGQGWIALIKDNSIVVERFTNWTDAKKAYRRARAAH